MIIVISIGILYTMFAISWLITGLRVSAFLTVGERIADFLISMLMFAIGAFIWWLAFHLSLLHLSLVMS